MRARPQKTHQQKLPDSGLLRCVDDIPRTFNVDLAIGLGAYLAVDSGAVGHGFTMGKRVCQHYRLRQIAWDESGID